MDKVKTATEAEKDLRLAIAALRVEIDGSIVSAIQSRLDDFLAVCFETKRLAEKLGQVVLSDRPDWATGFYLSSSGLIQWGKRTNREKAPEDYYFFDDLEGEELIAEGWIVREDRNSLGREITMATYQGFPEQEPPPVALVRRREGGGDAD